MPIFMILIMSLPDKFDLDCRRTGENFPEAKNNEFLLPESSLRSPILLLDEATFHLDNITELAVHQSLLKLAEGRTTIIVAH